MREDELRSKRYVRHMHLKKLHSVCNWGKGETGVADQVVSVLTHFNYTQKLFKCIDKAPSVLTRYFRVSSQSFQMDAALKQC